MNWIGKKVVITGGSSGIGYDLAKILKDRGCEISLVARDDGKMNQAVETLGCRGYLCDVADKNGVQETFSKILQDTGSVDVLINNAGYAFYKSFSESSFDEIDHMTRTNFMGTIYFTKLFLDETIRKARPAVLVNIASVAGKIPITPNLLYSAAKHGVVAFTELIDCEYRTKGIHTLLVLPGRVDTPFFDHESFKKRTHGFENKGMIPSVVMAEAIVNAVEKGKRELILPKKFQLVIYLVRAFPWIFKPVLRSVLTRRILKHESTLRELGGLSEIQNTHR